MWLFSLTLAFSEGGFEGFESPFVLALEGFEAFESFGRGFEAFVLTFEAFEGFLPFGAPPRLPSPSTLGPSKASKASKVLSRKEPGNQPQIDQPAQHKTPAAQ